MVATAVAVAMTAGFGPAPATPEGGATATTAGPDGATTPSGEDRVVTLLTGDRVTVGPDGQVRGVIRAEGREGVPVQVLRGQDTTLVLPADAAALIREGRLDRRLFDIGTLSDDRYAALDGLPVIVSYQDGTARAAATQRTLHAAAEPEVRAELDSIGAEALTIAPDEAAAAWAALTDTAGGEIGPRAAAGIESIALDGVVQATLDSSVPQVGAPEAWAAGYDGTGVTIAVLDTGIDAGHGDFDGKIAAAENFTGSPDVNDAFGHGTHVASIAAGTGDRSEGAYRGVAPGATLISGKVLDDGGGGWESEIIEGMEWAVEQGADIVNMSLGGMAGDEIDPMEEAVDRLSADSGALFVVAAGNDGPRARTIGTPGTADAALTVGAVDSSDALADFSSVGPRGRDGALKPDLTAPGVDIGAAAAEGSLIEEIGDPVADGYVAVSGTSMAAPHVAGAAALLAQRHPDWSGERLKAALTASALGLEGYSAYQQGTGRLDVPGALEQTVTTEANALDFGTVPWPHDVAEPVVRELTYHNSGDTDVTLALAASGTGPDGEPAPEGLFALGAEELTVPAGGSAAVQLTADPAAGGGAVGGFGVTVTATGDGQSVRSAGGVELAEEKFEVTFDVTGRDGEAGDWWDGLLIDPVSDEWYFIGSESGEPVTLRLPEGEYLADVKVLTGDAEEGELRGLDMMVMPSLTVDADTTVTVASASAEEVSMTVPDRRAEAALLAPGYRYTPADGWGLDATFLTGPLPEGLRTAQLGDVSPGTTLASSFLGIAQRPDTGREYHGFHTREGGFYTGLDHRVRGSQLARVTARLGSPGEGRVGALLTSASAVGLGVSLDRRELPAVADVRVQAGGTAWSHELWQIDPDGDGWEEASYGTGERVLKAGKSYRYTLNVGVFGPSFAGEWGLYRSGDELYALLPLLADGHGNGGGSELDGAETVLYRDGEVYRTWEEPLDMLWTAVPADRAEYRLVGTVTRGATGVADVSTEVVVDYTFTSERPENAGEDVRIAGPSAVRFTPRLAPDSTAPADRRYSVPVTVEGEWAGERPASVTVEVSLDRGETWRTARLHKGRLTLRNPAAGGSVSFRATVEDEAGNRSVQTVLDAYRTR